MIKTRDERKMRENEVKDDVGLFLLFAEAIGRGSPERYERSSRRSSERGRRLL